MAVTVLSALDNRVDRTLYLFSAADAVYLDQVAPGVRVIVARKRGWLARMLELSNFLNESRPDIVMPFLSYFITAIAAALSGGHGRVIFNQGTPTTGFLDDPDFAWRRPLRRLVFGAVTTLFYRRADAVVVTSQGVADDLATQFSVPRDKLIVLHNPVDIDAISAAAAAPVDDHGAGPIIVAAGRLAAVKNYPLLLEAAARISGARVWILGEGSERAALERLAASLGIDTRVRFWGFQKNPWSFIARADVFALTSTYEGFGNVLIEAMACGTPVVATRSPGTVEIIRDEYNGLLTEASVTVVVAAVERVLSDSTLRSQLIGGGSASVGHYAAPAVAQRYEHLFQTILAA